MATINDIVLIYMEDSPLAFARIEDIEPDHKRDWFHVKLLMLQVPLQVVTWILRDIYIEGEPFSMGGKQMRLEKVVCPEPDVPDEDLSEQDLAEDSPPEEGAVTDDTSKAKVISLKDLKKR